MGARYYLPAIGRFSQLDPLGSGYVYSSDNPANRLDPSGLDDVEGGSGPDPFDLIQRLLREGLTVEDLVTIHAEDVAGDAETREYLAGLSDQERLDFLASNPIVISGNTGAVLDGNARAYELMRRMESGSISPDTPVPFVVMQLPGNGDFGY